MEILRRWHRLLLFRHSLWNHVADVASGYFLHADHDFAWLDYQVAGSQLGLDGAFYTNLLLYHFDTYGYRRVDLLGHR